MGGSAMTAIVPLILGAVAKGVSVGRALGRATTTALALSAMLLLLVAPLHASEPQPRLAGDTRIHDPSIIEVDGKFAAFGTGEQGRFRGAIRVKTSPDGVNWTDAG